MTAAVYRPLKLLVKAQAQQPIATKIGLWLNESQAEVMLPITATVALAKSYKETCCDSKNSIIISSVRCSDFSARYSS